ncbi:ABC transporter ATP-binding protein [candidate division KSB1 bacterium]|nr:ABC transporter ATP-binding protein [candidate division KSB1 bacterium]
MIETHNLTKQFGSKTAVDGISLSIPAGQIFGLLGPNGAGKTTTVKMLTGMIQPTSGSATVAGHDVLKDPISVKQRIGVVPESGAVFQSLTPREYLQFAGRLYHMEEKDILTRLQELMTLFNLSDQIDQPMSSFSKGMRQKVVISSALLHEFEVLFLDEPLTGLDANTAMLMKELLRKLAQDGKTIFYCSHILEVVENLCDRVAILDQGKIVADGSIAELKTMTKQSCLEGVFRQLTNSEDAGELIRAFKL